MEKVAALKSQMGGPAKNPPPPEARPSYAELSTMRERLQRSELEKKSIEAELVSFFHNFTAMFSLILK